MSESEPQRAKVVFAGDSGVGKTSLINRLRHISGPVQATVQAAGFDAELEGGGRPVLVTFWDTAGQEQYQAMTPYYFHGAKVAIFVFDVTQQVTFENIPHWHRVIADILEIPIIFLLGNKVDLTDRVVEVEAGERCAETLGGVYVDVSAVTGFNIHSLREKLGTALAQQMEMVIGSESELSAMETDWRKQVLGVCC